jgi:hypothetical protein
MKSWPLYAGFVFLGLMFAASCTSRFRGNDIANAESAIRTDFERQGYTVEQVSLIKESDRRLSGFIKMRKSAGQLSKIQLTRNCVATMDADSSKYIWECK